MAGEQVGAATDDNTLEEIQPSRWPPSARSSCTRLNKVKSRLAGSFATAELIDDAAYASVCALNAKRCISDAQGRTSEPFARLLPSVRAARPEYADDVLESRTGGYEDLPEVVRGRDLVPRKL